MVAAGGSITNYLRSFAFPSQSLRVVAAPIEVVAAAWRTPVTLRRPPSLKYTECSGLLLHPPKRWRGVGQ